MVFFPVDLGQSTLTCNRWLARENHVSRVIITADWLRNQHLRSDWSERVVNALLTIEQNNYREALLKL